MKRQGPRIRPHAGIAALLVSTVLLTCCGKSTTRAAENTAMVANGSAENQMEGQMSGGPPSAGAAAAALPAKADLRDAFRAQGGALNRICARPNENLRPRCLGAANLRAQIGARVEQWNALPDESNAFGPLRRRLLESAEHLHNAADDTDRRAALDSAEATLHELERLLDTAGR